MQRKRNSSLFLHYMLTAIAYGTLFCYAAEVKQTDTLERLCVPCHVRLDISLQKSFMNALLVYGGKENLKAGLAYYFRHPSRETSVMDEDFVRKNGIKAPLHLSKKEMDEALEAYWQRYSVIGRLR